MKDMFHRIVIGTSLILVLTIIVTPVLIWEVSRLICDSLVDED